MTDNHPERIDTKLIKSTANFNCDGITFPVHLKQIDRFEKQNPTISVNVFDYEKKKLTILRKTENYKRENIVDLLLISKGEVQHYCVIKNLSRLISSQYNKHQGGKYPCRECLNIFKTQKSLEKHIKYCYSEKPITIEMPKEGSILKFKSFFRKMRVPFVVYADFESSSFWLLLHSMTPPQNSLKKISNITLKKISPQ